MIEKSAKIGFCYGVRRAVRILEKAGREQGEIESLGEVIHNEQVMRRLINNGVKVIHSVNEIQGKTIVLGAHGVAPEVIKELKSRRIKIIDTTCPFVRRAQTTAKKLADAGFFVIIYGNEEHAEVKGILGWANGNGLATTDEKQIAPLSLPHHIGILSQTTQIPARYLQFSKKVIDTVFTKDSEIHIIDTICHDIRDRQSAALELAKRMDLILVVGGENSANTLHLAELCATVVTTYKIASVSELKTVWFRGKEKIGITTGSSTADETVDEVVKRLESLS